MVLCKNCKHCNKCEDNYYGTILFCEYEFYTTREETDEDLPCDQYEPLDVDHSEE